MSDGALEHQRAEIVPTPMTIVTALPLKADARRRLAELMQARVVDVRESVDRADLVLSPSSSPQLLGALKRQYEGARVVVVELDDWDLDISLAGPVKRIIAAGADAYVVADSLDELAHKLTAAPAVSEPAGIEPAVREVTVRELPQSTVDDLIAAFLQDSADERERLRSSPRVDDRRDRADD